MCDKDVDCISSIHHALIEPLRQHGKAPSRKGLADAAGLPLEEIDRRLALLVQTHGVVLHPHNGEPWVVHPFSTSPTAVWVENGGVGWWAPCMWCALGVAHLAGGNVTIHVRLGGERETVAIHVENGEVLESGLLVHFAVAPRDAWDNVHHFCSTVLPFRHEEDVSAWCERHAISRGVATPIANANTLARLWYSKHADPRWRKWSKAEAAEIFAKANLLGAFWEFDKSAEHV